MPEASGKPTTRPVKKAAARPAQASVRGVSRPNIRPVTQMGLEWINFGLYAWPGAGKTTFLGTSDSRTLIGDCDRRGVVSAGAAGSEAQGVSITDYNELEEVYQFLRHGGTDEFNWFWWDSLTLFQDATLIDDILDEAHAQNPIKQDPDVPSMREYLKSQTRIGRYIRQFCDLPINFGCTFHVTSFETPDGSVLWAPLLQGGKNNEFSTKIHGYLNVLGYLYAKEKEGVRTQYLRTRENGEYLAKDKFRVLPALMKNPTMPQVEKLIRDKFPAPGSSMPSTRPAKKAAKKTTKKG